MFFLQFRVIELGETMFFRFVIVQALLISSFALADLPISITSPSLGGDCVSDDIQVVEENGQFFIAAFFTNMDAIAETKVIDKKSCRMRYNLQIAPGYHLNLFQFSVDGVYQLSEHGTARLTVSHRVVNNTSARTTKFYSAAQGDALAGDIHDFSGAISKNDLPGVYGNCGASIPMTTSIYAEAVKPSSDQSGLTRISLDEGVSSNYVKLCQVIVSTCTP